MKKRGKREIKHNSVQCEWCKDEERPIYCKCKALCRRCYDIERKLSVAENALASAPLLPNNEWGYQVAKRLKELAIWEGELYGNIEKQEVDGIQIEMQLRFMSKRLVGKELFSGWANTFDWDFGLKQRRIILECIAKVMRQYFQKRRHLMASVTAYEDTEWRSLI